MYSTVNEHRKVTQIKIHKLNYLTKFLNIYIYNKLIIVNIKTSRPRTIYAQNIEAVKVLQYVQNNEEEL
jgi:hypothetical protein